MIGPLTGADFFGEPSAVADYLGGTAVAVSPPVFAALALVDAPCL
jgi:hypothetical protein